MSETTQAASSPVEVEDVFQGQEPTLSEFNKYRADGELPERFRTAEQSESATDDTQEETEESESESSESASESETEEETQEQVPAKTAKRIKQLLAERHELERKLEAATKTDVKTESSTPVVPKNAFPKPTAEDKNTDGTLKYGTYEDFTEALGRWAAKEERVSWERESAEKQAMSALKTTMDEARSRYDDADEVIFPAAQTINEAKIPLAVKEVFSQSENFIDLCYVVGSDPDELKKFIQLAQSNPRAAIGKVFEYERGIKEELGKGGTERDASGKFKTAPEKKTTTAPKPPSTVGGGSSKAFDVSDESLSPEEWMRKRTADLARRS